MRDRASHVAHEARIPDYNLQRTAGTEPNHNVSLAGPVKGLLLQSTWFCSGGCGISRKIAQPGCQLFLPGPMVDDASAHQEIVLMVVGGIGKSSEVVIDLNYPHREMCTYRDIDAATDASGKPVGAIGDASLSASSVRRAKKNLRERLRFVISLQPGLRNFVTAPAKYETSVRELSDRRCAAVFSALISTTADQGPRKFHEPESPHHSCQNSRI